MNKSDILELNDLLKGKKQIAMQDHETHEQYKADKLKYGTTTSDLDKGGPGSGPNKKAHTYEEKQAKKNAAYERIKAKYHQNKDPALLRQLEDLVREMKEDAKVFGKGGIGSGRHSQLKGTALDLRESYLNWLTRTEVDPDSEHARRMLELFSNKIREFVKENRHKRFRKALMDNDNNVAIDTADYSVTEEAAKDWLGDFQYIMKDYNYGDLPRELNLDNGHVAYIVKVDDGQYSGYVKQTVEHGEPLEENIGRFEKVTLPEIIEYCKAREYIVPEANSQAKKRIEEEAVIVEEINDNKDLGAKKLRFMELLNTLLKDL